MGIRQICSAVVVGTLALLVFGGCSSDGDDGSASPIGSCDNVGCGATPYCDQGCQARCGCCPCAPGDTWSSPRGETVCGAGCWELVVDAGVDGSADAGNDSSVDPCANVGCSPPPMCDTGCTAECGCCACGEGERIPIDGGSLLCQGGCYVRTDGGGDAASDAAGQ